MSIHRFFVEDVHMYGPQPGKRRRHYRIRDKDQCHPGFGAKTIATIIDDAEMADRICGMLNGVGVYPDNIEAVRIERDAACEQRDIAKHHEAVARYGQRQAREALTTGRSA